MKDFYNHRDEIFEKLPRIHLIVFGNLTCEKMLRQYELFSKVHNWGDTIFFQNIIISIYDYVTGRADGLETSSKLADLEDLSPDLDEFDGGLPSYALDACVSLSGLLEFIGSGKIEHLKVNSDYSLNTLDMYVQEIEDLDPSGPNTQTLIDQHPYMQTEVRRQLQTLEELSQIVTIDAATIGRLQEINSTFPYLIELSSLHEL